MGRPRKDTEKPEARERLIEAFWSLLETHNLQDITVGIVAAEAQCNRGSFYYHFDTREEFFNQAIDDMLAENDLPEIIFGLLIGKEPGLEVDSRRLRCVHRISLMTHRGGYELTKNRVCNFVKRIWLAAIDFEGEDLDPEIDQIMEFNYSGIMGLLAAVRPSKVLPATDDALMEYQSNLPLEYLRRITACNMARIAELCHISEDELFQRLQAFVRYSNLHTR